MTAPLVAELRRRRPELRLTIQTALPRDFLATRYDDFDYVGEIPDIGFRMRTATDIDLDASAAFYRALHADFAAVVRRETDRLGEARPDLVLANVPYVTIAAAAAAKLPVLAYSSLNWADLTDHYFAQRTDCRGLRAEIRASYEKAALFLQTTPAQPMSLSNLRTIGPVARLGTPRAAEIRTRLGLADSQKLGLIAFGGMDRSLPLEQWQVVPGWFWLTSAASIPVRADMADWRAAGVSFSDLIASVDLVVTKSGYGTFSECALRGVPVLYEPRPDWPEAPPLERWLHLHTQCLAVTAEEMIHGDLAALLHKLFLLPKQPVATPTGIKEGADIMEGLLDGIGVTSMAVEAAG